MCEGEGVYFIFELKYEPNHDDTKFKYFFMIQPDGLAATRIRHGRTGRRDESDTRGERDGLPCGRRQTQLEMMASNRSSCKPSDSPALGVIPICWLASATAGIAGVAGAMSSSRLSRASLCYQRTGAGAAGAAAAAAASSFGEAWGAEVSR